MAIDYDAVLRNPRVRGLLGDRLIAVEDDRDLLFEIVAEEAHSVLVVEWDGSIPGGAGANYLKEWCGLYFIDSSDHDKDGPFATLEEAFESEHLVSAGMQSPQLTSDTLAARVMMQLARRVAATDGDTVRVNGRRLVSHNGRLRNVEAALGQGL